MAVRESMSDLIRTVRRMIGDPESVDSYFTDQDIQDVLDRRRIAVRYMPLLLVDTIGLNGAVTYEEFHDPTGRGNWEGGVAIADPNYAALTPATSNLISGVWTFSPGLTYPSAYITGAQYDINAVAADLLEEWMAGVKKEFTFSSASRSYQRGEQTRNFEAAISKYRSRSWILVGELVDTGTMPSRRRWSSYDSRF